VKKKGHIVAPFFFVYAKNIPDRCIPRLTLATTGDTHGEYDFFGCGAI